jgi:hypothetical protein
VPGVAGGEIACRDARSPIAGAVQCRVDRDHPCRRDSDDAGPILLASLDVAEPERPVPHNRSTKGQAELVLVQRILANRERVLLVEPIVAEELVGASAVPVRARLCDDADRAARRAAELGAAARRHDFELADHFLAQVHPRQVGRVVVGRQAVDDEVVVQIALTRHRNAGAWNGRRLGEPIRRAQVGARHVRRQQREVEIIPPVERQAVDFARGDDRRELSAPHLHDLRAGGNRVHDGNARDLHHNRDVNLIADREAQVHVRRRETCQLCGEVIVADRQVQDSEPAGPIGD